MNYGNPLGISLDVSSLDMKIRNVNISSGSFSLGMVFDL
jgi:hypothetical protein